MSCRYDVNCHKKLEDAGEVQQLTTNAFFSVSKHFDGHHELQLSTILHGLEASIQQLDLPISKKDYMEWFEETIQFEIAPVNTPSKRKKRSVKKRSANKA